MLHPATTSRDAWLRAARSRRGLIAAAVLSCLLVAGHAPAEPAWVKASPGGGGAFLTSDVSVSGKVLVGSDLSGAYLRTGSGNWTRLGKLDGLNRTYISCVRWSPVTGDTALVSCRNGVFRSLNGGVSWQATNGPSFDTEFFSALGWSRSNALTIYAAGAGTSSDTTTLLWKSIDGGGNWTTIVHDLPTTEALRVLKLVVDPSDANTVYAVTGPDGLIAPKVLTPKRAIYKSTNGGVNWVLKSGADDALDVAVNPATPGLLLMTTSTGTDNTGQVKRSANGGDTWTPTLDNTGAIWWDGTNAFLINIGLDACPPIPANAGRFQSVDGGLNWARVDTGATWEVGWSDCQHARGIPFSGVCNALSAKGEYWVTSQFVWRNVSGKFTNAFSSNMGPGRWITTGIDNVTPVSIADAQNAATLYAGYYDLGLWRTQDGGASWTMINPTFAVWGGVGANVTCVVADSARPGVLWASIGESSKAPYLYRVYKSTTSGNTWTQISSGLPYPAFLYGLTMDRLSPSANRILWITANGALYKSTDDGATWQPASTTGGLPSVGLFATEVDRRNSNTVYVGGWSGLWRSLDGGTSWGKLAAGFDYTSAPGEIGVQNTLLHRVKWHGPQQILSDPFTPGKVWVTSYVKDTTEILSLNRGLYMSTNDGGSFTELRRGPLYRGIAIDSAGRRAMVSSSPASSSGSNGSEIEESKGLEIGRSTNGLAWTWSLDPPNPDLRYPFAWSVYSGGTGQRWLGAPGYGFMRKPNAPTAVNDAVVVGQNSSGNLLPVLMNDWDPDFGDTISLQSLNLSGTLGSASIAGGWISYSPPGGFTGVDHLAYTIHDIDGNTASATVAVNVVFAGAELAIPISASSDDAEESATGSMNLASTDLDLTFDLSQQKVGMRFNSVTVPHGSAISSAYIQFTVDETSADATNLTIHGQAADNPLTFTGVSTNISSRPLTSASVPWSPVSWTQVGAAGLNEQTPGLSSIVSEIVNRPGWASGHSMVFIITGPGRRVAQSWDFSPAGAPVLHVTYGGNIPVGVDDPSPATFALERAGPGPARGSLHVELSLPDRSPARLELIDITGRRVAAREVGALGPGRHRVEVARALRAGVYLVRLTQGPHARTLKAVVLN